MRTENIKTIDDAQQYVEGCINDFESGISSKQKTLNLLGEYTARIMEIFAKNQNKLLSPVISEPSDLETSAKIDAIELDAVKEIQNEIIRQCKRMKCDDQQTDVINDCVTDVATKEIEKVTSKVRPLFPFKDKSKDGGAEQIKKIRDKFFAECTEKMEVDSPNKKYTYPRVSLAPHDLFEWFKKYLFVNEALNSISSPSVKAKDLCEISEEDAIEVASILNFGKKMNAKIEYKDNRICVVDKYLGNIDMDFDGHIHSFCPDPLTCYKAYQYLQSKGYKLPQYFPVPTIEERESKHHFAREIFFTLKSCQAISEKVYLHWIDKLILDEQNSLPPSAMKGEEGNKG